MLYLFDVNGTDFVKMGFTGQTIWARVADGFWRNKHPKGCCHKLGFANMELLMLVPGTLADEAVIQAQLPPDEGEFWHKDRLVALKAALLAQCGEPLPMQAKPAEPYLGRSDEKFQCCGGVLIRCFECGKEFKLYKRLLTHKKESCPATAEPKVVCACGQEVIRRLLPRHQQSQSCKRKRAPEE
jgi:hypothetical protein